NKSNEYFIDLLKFILTKMHDLRSSTDEYKGWVNYLKGNPIKKINILLDSVKEVKLDEVQLKTLLEIYKHCDQEDKLTAKRFEKLLESRSCKEEDFLVKEGFPKYFFETIVGFSYNETVGKYFSDCFQD